MSVGLKGVFTGVVSELSYIVFLGPWFLWSIAARGVMEEIQGLLGEANGIMHEDLSARLNNVALIDGEGSSEPAQEEDVGQGAGCHVQVSALPLH